MPADVAGVLVKSRAWLPLGSGKQGPVPIMKERFYDQLQTTVAKVPATEILIPVGDWNGHVGTAAGVYSEAHGGHGYGTRNPDGERMLEFAIANELRVGNTWFKKRNSHLVTYSSGGHSTQIVRFCARKRHHRRNLHRPPDAREAPSRKQAPLLRLCRPGKGLRPRAKEGAMVGPKERRRGGMVDQSHPRHVH